MKGNPFTMKKKLLSALLITAMMLSIFTVAVTTTTASSTAPYRCGDVNGDGNISITDALEVLKYLAGLDNVMTTANRNVINQSAFDASRLLRGAVPTINDVLEILKKLAGLTSVIDSINCSNCNWCAPGKAGSTTGGGGTTTGGTQGTTTVTATGVTTTPLQTTTTGTGTTGTGTTTTQSGTTVTTLSTTLATVTTQIIAPELPPRIETRTEHLPGGTVGTQYNFNLVASGAGPITWTISAGALPQGLVMSTGGVISGTPIAAGVATFQVIAANANGNSSAIVLSITVNNIVQTTTTGTTLWTDPTTTTTSWSGGTLSTTSTTTVSGTTPTATVTTTSGPIITEPTTTITTVDGDPAGTPRIVYNMGDDATFNSIAGHPVLSSRNGANDTVIAGTGAARTITMTNRGGTSQGVDILLSSLNLRANHHYRFEVTGRVTTGTGNQSVFFNNVSDRTASAPAVNANLLPPVSVAVNSNFTFTHTTDFAAINAHAQAGANAVYRIGGASQQTLVVSRLVITTFCPSGCTCGPLIAPRSFANLTANQLIADIGVGWNLGNAFDYHENGRSIGYAMSTDVADLEVRWLGRTSANRTSRQLIEAIKNAGFNTIRIPVTWYKVADQSNDFRIRDAWMNRIQEVVDIAISLDMFVILNTHHEYPLYNWAFRSNNANPPMPPSEDDFNRARAMLQSLWRQIGTRFSAYGEKLIFEGLNEPRDFADSQWYGYGRGSEHPVDPRTPILHARINTLNQDFVTAVRNTGGNNHHRILMMPAYAASGFFWNSAGPLDHFRRPNDIAQNASVNKFVLSVHRYEPKEWTIDGNASDGSGEFTDERLRTMVTTALAGIAHRAQSQDRQIRMPVILGEWGTTNSANYNAARRATYSEWYVREATRLGMRTVIWDNGANNRGAENLGLFSRANGSVNSGYQVIIDAIRRGRGLIT
jgi:endoglucanase